jgi:alpha-tubulin suppressor-like RCC1 family protein
MAMRHSWTIWLPPMMALALPACTDEFTSTETPTVSVNAVVAFPDTLIHGESRTLQVRVLDASSGVELAQAQVRWTSSDSSVLGVVEDTSSRGMLATVLARASGSALLTMSAVAGTGAAELRAYSKTIVVAERWIEVAAGGAHTCGISVDSLPYCWGAGGYLGNGTVTGSPTPKGVLGVPGVLATQVAAGAYASCIIEVRGLLYCWGPNLHGEVGNGSIDPHYVPTIGGSGGLYSQVSIGGDHACGQLQTFENRVFCWGKTDYRGLGLENLSSNSISQIVRCVLVFTDPTFLGIHQCLPRPTGPVQRPEHWTITSPVSAGGSHSCAVDNGELTSVSKGWVWCWGLGSVGQLGISSGECFNCGFALCVVNPLSGSDEVPCSNMTRRVNTTQRMVTVAAGWDDDGSRGGKNLNNTAHTCGIGVDSLAYCWGLNDLGEVGSPTSDPTPCVTLQSKPSWKCVRSPVAVQTALKFTAIGAGARHTCALGAADSLVYCWGDNSQRQLGEQPGGFRFEPRAVATAANERFVKLSVGAWHSCAIAAGGGRLYCWGKNANGQVGAQTAGLTSGPMRVSEPRR